MGRRVRGGPSVSPRAGMTGLLPKDRASYFIYLSFYSYFYFIFLFYFWSNRVAPGLLGEL
jgi:hypothetical protein